MCTAPLSAGCCRRQIFEWVKAHGGEPIIPFSGIFENKLFDMPADEKEAYCKEVHVALCFDTAPVNLGQHAPAVHFQLGWFIADCSTLLAFAGRSTERVAEDHHDRLPRNTGAFFGPPPMT